MLKSIVLIFLLLAHMAQAGKFELKQGDLLFQDLDCGPMCDAIEEVTRGVNGARLSHVGLVVLENNIIQVAESVSEGVKITPLNDFINRSKDENENPKILVGRLIKEYQNIIPKVIELLADYIGKPYNTSFIMGEDCYYCSQLLYLIFKKANNEKEVFSLEPMTFKQANSDEYFNIWQDYYDDLNISIPEGKPGINPGGMSRSPLIKIVHSYGKPEGWDEQ